MRPKRPPIKATGHLPKPGSALRFPDLPLEPDRLWRRLYIRGVDDELEKLHGFRPGGYHPIHLHDELHDGQYRVIHKLGHGGYSTVWLCRDQHVDTPSYVAVKILVASETGKNNRELLLANKLKEEGMGEIATGRQLCLPRTHFTSQSPNGTHLCLVYPVLGPTVRDAAYIFDGQDGAVQALQGISQRVVESLATLHSRHICHGDFRPSNILLELQMLDGLDEEQVFSLLGEPETTEVYVRKDSRPTPTVPYAPSYLVYPPDFRDIEVLAISTSAQIIDFGQSYDTTQQPTPTAFGIPANYAAPEVTIDSSGTGAMDLWSLGCTLYELRLGKRLFDVFQLIGLRKKDYVDEIASILGEPPEPWAQYYTESNMDQTIFKASSVYSEDTIDHARAKRVRSLREKIASCHDCTGQECAHPRYQLISEAEAALLADLLEKLLRYAPDERLSAQEALKHAWFSVDDIGAVESR